MPITGTGWELYIKRLRTQTRKKPGDTRVRAIGSYQVYGTGHRSLIWRARSSYLDAKFETKDGLRIPNAWVVIDEIQGS